MNAASCCKMHGSLVEAMASPVQPATCVTAKLTHPVNSRQQAYSCKPCANSSCLRPSPITPRRSTRTCFRVQCQAKSLKQAKPMTASELQEKFGCSNVKFLDVAGMTVIELKLNSGTAVRILLQQARITSYKCRLWHGSLEEFLYTDVLEPPTRSASDSTDGMSPAQFGITGGIVPSLAHSLPPRLPIFEDDWLVDWVQADPHEQIQVCLRSAGEGRGGWQYTSQFFITLTKGYLASCVEITNDGQKPMAFTGSITTHLAISSTEALCAVGLQGSEYFSPSEAARQLTVKDASRSSLFGSFKRFVLGRATEKDKGDVAVSSVAGTRRMEEENRGNLYQDRRNWFLENEGDVISLNNGVQKVYSEPPKQIRMTDQGFRRSLVFESYGFGNLVTSSPQSDDDDKPFVAVGCASILSPVMLDPKSVWRGAQILGPDTE